MNVHFVLMFKRVDASSLIRAAANAVGYRLLPTDRVYVYTNFCLDTSDLSNLHRELGCEVYLQPLPCRDNDAIAVLPDIVTRHAYEYPNDANLLVDASGKCKRSHTMIIPSISSSLKG